MKIRLDQLLVDKGLATSRERAKTSIMAGNVFVDNQKIDKPGTKVDENAHLTIKGAEIPYVSRGGLKLEKAINTMGFSVSGKIVLDVGASTGGFTDCALQHGAKKIIAVDVGYGQLAWSLRQDPRVTCLERTNIRYLTIEEIGAKADIATIDVAFISLEKVLPTVKNLLNNGCEILALIKPQFEAGRENVGKKGVVRDPQVHKQVISHIIQFAADIGLSARDLDYSPITGPEGNIEYLLWLKDSDANEGEKSWDEHIDKLVERAFIHLS